MLQMKGMETSFPILLFTGYYHSGNNTSSSCKSDEGNALLWVLIGFYSSNCVKKTFHPK